MARQLTITLDDETAEKLEQTRRTDASVDLAVNEAVRKVLDERAVTAKEFVIHPVHMGELLIDISCTGRALEYLDELDAQEKRSRHEKK